MGRLIDADALMDDIRKHSESYFADDFAHIWVDKQPTVDAEPVRHSRWIYGEDEYGIDGYFCEKCGEHVKWDYQHHFINFIEKYEYCTYCGAKMGGVKHE